MKNTATKLFSTVASKTPSGVFVPKRAPLAVARTSLNYNGQQAAMRTFDFGSKRLASSQGGATTVSELNWIGRYLAKFSDFSEKQE
jgi:hypothetical protein